MNRKIFDNEFESSLTDHLFELIAPRCITFVRIADMINAMPERIRISEASRLTGIPKKHFLMLYKDHGVGCKFGTSDTSPIYLHKYELVDVVGRYKLSDEQVRKAILNIEEKLNKTK